MKAQVDNKRVTFNTKWITFGAHTALDSNDPLSFLLQGFLERTKEVGLVVTSWAPQVQILIESQVDGRVLDPLRVELNPRERRAWCAFDCLAALCRAKDECSFAEDIRCHGARVKMNDRGIVESRDIEKYAKDLIEGDEGKLLKKKMIELKEVTKVALSQDGSSTKSLAEPRR